MTPAEDLSAIISAQLASLADAVALELRWLDLGNVDALAKAKASRSAVLGHLEGAFRSHFDRAITTIAAAGAGNTELLVRIMLQIFLLEVAALAAQNAKA